MDLTTALKQFADALTDRGPEERTAAAIEAVALAVVAAAAAVAPAAPVAP
jgi:hypothetical protein